MKNIIIFSKLIIIILLSNTVYSQKNTTSFWSVGTSIGIAKHKETFKTHYFPFLDSLHKSNNIDWGINVAWAKKHQQMVYHVGLGYMKHNYNFLRDYDDRGLSSDSFPIGRTTSKYVYHTLELPIGIKRMYGATEKSYAAVGVEVRPGFLFKSVYVPTAKVLHKSKKNGFEYYGTSFLLTNDFAFKLNKNYIVITPYCQVLATYGFKDDVVYQKQPLRDEWLQGFGVSVGYSFR